MPSMQERIAAIRAARQAAKDKDEARASARASMKAAVRAPRPPKSKTKPAVSKAAETKAAKAADVKEA